MKIERQKTGIVVAIIVLIVVDNDRDDDGNAVDDYGDDYG